MKIWSAIAASCLMLSALAACGGDDTSAYCDALDDFKSNSQESVEDGGIDELSKLTDELRDKAPSDVKDDWDLMSEAFDGDGGLGAGDDDDQPSQDKLQKAGKNIEDHAQDKCDIDLTE